MCIALEDDAKSPYRAAASDLIATGFSLWQGYINTSAALRMLIRNTGLAGGDVRDQQLPSSLMQIARQGVERILEENGTLFVETVRFDLTHSKGAGDRVAGLKLLGMFISRVSLIGNPLTS